MLSVSRLGWIDLRPVEDDPRPESIEVVEFRQPVLEEACEVLSVDTELETESCPGDSRPVGDKAISIPWSTPGSRVLPSSRAEEGGTEAP